MLLPSKFLSGNNMKYVKLALISFILLFGIATLISLLLPSTVIVSRAIDISGSRDSIVYQISNLSEWKSWLANRDTLAVEVKDNNTFRMGETKVAITAVSATEVKTEWQVKEGQKMPGTFNIISHQGTPLITVQWQFVQKLKWYPWEKFASIVSDKVLGPFMEQSLDNLKKRVEQPD
jgi:hypothetical protein